MQDEEIEPPDLRPSAYRPPWRARDREAPAPPHPEGAPAEEGAGAGQRVGRDMRVEARGGSVAFAQAQTVNYYQAAAPSTPVPLPHRIGRVPARAARFQEREVPELASLAEPPSAATGGRRRSQGPRRKA